MLRWFISSYRHVCTYFFEPLHLNTTIHSTCLSSRKKDLYSFGYFGLMINLITNHLIRGESMLEIAFILQNRCDFRLKNKSRSCRFIWIASLILTLSESVWLSTVNTSLMICFVFFKTRTAYLTYTIFQVNHRSFVINWPLNVANFLFYFFEKRLSNRCL